MTGKEHYDEAERLLGMVKAPYPFLEDASAMQIFAQAQAHATLALAQATLSVALGGAPTLKADSIMWGWGER
jgi:hypothetical protein